MKKMIAYRMGDESRGRLELLATSLRITKTSVLEYCLEYCLKNQKFISYAMDRREGLKPKVGSALTNWLSKSNGEGHAE